MRKIAFAAIAIFLFALTFGAPAVTNAAEGTLCWADDYELAIGEVTGVYCTGYTPLTMINVYYVEPGGTANYYFAVKSDAAGNVSFLWDNGVKNAFSYTLGTYSIVVQELGLADSIKYIGKVEIKNIGDGDNVSGAYLVSNVNSIDRSSQAVTLTGWGFAPGEVVSFWMQRPPLCGSFTVHYVDGGNGTSFENIPVEDEVGTFGIGDITADANGGFVVTLGFDAADCEGTYRVAARGNSSDWGAYAEFIVTGPAVSTNAWLVPSKDRVGAFNDTIEFYAYGFGSNEILNCYTTSPDGRAISYGIPNSLSAIKMGADGTGVISLTTGSYIVSPDNPFAMGNTIDPLMSEGSIGLWKLTCKGLASGTTAIAEYTVYGYALTP